MALGSTAADGRKPVVFVIDDDQDFLEAVRATIACAGLVPVVYTSPAQFLREYSPVSEACIVLDVRMPQMSGFEVLGKLREHDAPNPVIMISGASIEKEARELQVAVVAKPFDPEELLLRIEEAIASQGPREVSAR